MSFVKILNLSSNVEVVFDKLPWYHHTISFGVGEGYTRRLKIIALNSGLVHIDYVPREMIVSLGTNPIVWNINITLGPTNKFSPLVIGAYDAAVAGPLLDFLIEENLEPVLTNMCLWIAAQMQGATS